MNSSTKRAFSIRIFLPDGSADGLKIVEKSNWSGRGIVCPRAIFQEHKSRDEFSNTGVYVLIGPSDAGDVPTIYVGQGDPVRPRLNSHQANKDFWTTVVFFVSKDETLNKAHIGYLEARLIMLAKEANRSVLDNANSPVLPSMSEMDVADAEGFLDETLLCLPVLGVNAFTKPDTASPRVSLQLAARDADARGFESTDGFVVLTGGKVRAVETASMNRYLIELRESLLERGILVRDGTQYRLTQDYTFNSPSQAASVVMGRNANGRIHWKDSQGVTLKEIQEQNAGLDPENNVSS